jgi:hypothetical protein
MIFTGHLPKAKNGLPLATIVSFLKLLWHTAHKVTLQIKNTKTYLERSAFHKWHEYEGREIITCEKCVFCLWLCTWKISQHLYTDKNTFSEDVRKGKSVCIWSLRVRYISTAVGCCMSGHALSEVLVLRTCTKCTDFTTHCQQSTISLFHKVHQVFLHFKP